MNADVESEAATAPTVTASESENPVDQNQVADSDEIVTSHPFESKPEGTEELAAPESKAGIASGSPEPAAPADLQNEWEKVDEGEMSFTKRGPGRPRKIVTAEAAADKIVKLALDRLLPHPLNKKLFGPTSPDEIKVLAESIAETGQLVPLVVTADLEKIGYYALLSGHKRADALRSLGRAEANCQVVDVKDADERLLRLVEANRQHKPTTEQNIRIGEVYLGLETRKAKARKVAGAKSAKEGGKEVETLTQAEARAKKVGDAEEVGKARDLAAKKVGMSGVSFERGLKTLKAAEKAEQDGKNETAAELRRILNKNGIEPAYSHAKSVHLIAQTTKKKAAESGAKEVTVPKDGADTPQNPAPVADGHKTDEVVPPPVLLLANAGEAETVPQPATDSSQVAGRTSAAVDASEADDVPLVVSIITACNKLVDDLEELDPADLSTDQKWNLTHAFDAISEWFGNHEQTLELPGQL